MFDPQTPSTPAADPHAARADARARHRRRFWRTVIGIGSTASAIVVVGALVTGYLSVVGTGSCERDEQDREVCVRRSWWPFTIMQRAEHWSVDGVADGPRLEWHVDGTPWITGAWQNGQRVGPWREYWPDGQLRFSGVYVEDKLDGTEAWFYADGAPEWVIERKAGIRVGVERWYWPDGTLRREGSWRAGEKHGVFVSRNADGVVIANSRYVNGVEQSKD